MLPSTPKKVRKVLQIVLHAGASLVFLGIGSVAAGLLFSEESVFKAMLLFLVALGGALGSIFFFSGVFGRFLPSRRDRSYPPCRRLVGFGVRSLAFGVRSSGPQSCSVAVRRSPFAVSRLPFAVKVIGQHGRPFLATKRIRLVQ